jgi:hypothetical protein
MAKFDGVAQQGLKALSLLDEHGAVTARLPSGHAEYLKQRLTELGASVPAQKVARQAARQSSADQRLALTQVRLLLTAIRDAVRTDADATAADRKEYGVGQRLGLESPKALIAAAQGVLKAARAKPQRAQTLSILPEDVTKLEALLQAAIAADANEDSSRAAAPLSTKRRNELTKNVSDAVKKIAGAGILAFALDEKVRVQFEALIEGPAKRSPKTPSTPQ